ncbi:MAG: TlpA family protein disulfide reductase [Bacteriovoracaceae bacterium]|nr:TlpA family protein disulfide reductase [Bacteriovoracaceae bacterium]
MKVLIIFFFLLQGPLWAKELKNFSLPIYKEEKTFSFPLKSKRKLVINFWATWCTSCIQEIPLLEKLKKDYPKVEFVAVSAGDTPKKISKFLKKHGFSYKILMDKDKSFSKGMGILNLPQTLVIDESGNIIYQKDVPPTKL